MWPHLSLHAFVQLGGFLQQRLHEWLLSTAKASDISGLHSVGSAKSATYFPVDTQRKRIPIWSAPLLGRPEFTGTANMTYAAFNVQLHDTGAWIT